MLSLLALALNVPVTFWSILSAMGLLFSKTWTVELARELGDEVESRQVDGASKQVGISVVDNKCYMMPHKYMHAVVTRDGVFQSPTNGQMLYTNNRLHVPLILPSEILLELGT